LLGALSHSVTVVSAFIGVCRRLIVFEVIFDSIRVYLRLSRSNARFPDVSRTINHQELAEVIGTGFICG
jgi:hypothetical protein